MIPSGSGRIEREFKRNALDSGTHLDVNQDRKDFLTVARVLPARLDSNETALFLGFAPHDIPILVAAGLLKPLGHPPRNGVKYFASVDLSKLSVDVRWLSRATDATINHWKIKNTLKPEAQDKALATE